MLFGLLGAVAGIKPIKGQVADRDARDRRRRRHPEEPQEDQAPNPDFDFGPMPSTRELAQPRAAERHLSQFFLVLGILAMIPVVMLLGVLFLLL